MRLSLALSGRRGDAETGTGALARSAVSVFATARLLLSATGDQAVAPALKGSCSVGEVLTAPVLTATAVRTASPSEAPGRTRRDAHARGRACCLPPAISPLRRRRTLAPHTHPGLCRQTPECFVRAPRKEEGAFFARLTRGRLVRA